MLPCSTFQRKENIDNKMSEDSKEPPPPAKKPPPPSPTFIDSSKKDEQGRPKEFCARCKIIANIGFDHSPRCKLVKQDKAVENQFNDAPFAQWICKSCNKQSDYPHLVPVAGRPGEYPYSDLMAKAREEEEKKAAKKVKREEKKTARKRAKKEEAKEKQVEKDSTKEQD